MTSYTTTFTEQLGGSDEQIEVTIEYCEDFNDDGYDDIRVTLAIADGSNSGTEDLIGVAFDIQNNDVDGLLIGDINTSTDNGVLSTFVPTSVIGADQVSDNGPLDPGFNTTGGGSDEPYDVGIKFSELGSGEGIVQEASFVIYSNGADLDAEALIENTDWWIRLQSTDGGQESAKTGGFILDLPACEDDEDHDPGTAMTPGFWKNHGDIFLQETGLALTDSYEDVFGVDVIGITVSNGKNKIATDDPSLGQALSALGGGEAALLRASTAAWANAGSDDLNYAFDDPDTLEAAVAEALGIDPLLDPVGFADAYQGILDLLELIDLNGDGALSQDEVINSVQDLYDDSDAGTDHFGWADVGAVAQALDAMNNMPHIDASEFVV